MYLEDKTAEVPWGEARRHAGGGAGRVERPLRRLHAVALLREARGASRAAIGPK